MEAWVEGEETIGTSDKNNYAANVEKAEIGERPFTFDAAATGELEKVHTPGLPGIEDVGKFMKVKPKNMLKTLVFQATGGKIECHRLVCVNPNVTSRLIAWRRSAHRYRRDWVPIASVPIDQTAQRATPTRHANNARTWRCGTSSNRQTYRGFEA